MLQGTFFAMVGQDIRIGQGFDKIRQKNEKSRPMLSKSFDGNHDSFIFHVKGFSGDDLMAIDIIIIK